MAAPNIAALTTITGKTDILAATVTPTAIVTNSASSNKVLKINSLIVSNINIYAATITVELYRSSTAYPIAYKINIVPNTSTVILGKDTLIYLIEGDVLRLTASIDGYLSAICSYEEIS